MSDLAKKKGIHSKKIIYFPNWSETKQFNNQEKNFYFIRNLGLDPDKKIILYAGNIGEKQGLEILIDVADKMKQNKDIQFVVVGEGSTKERLIKKSENAKLENISFLPLQEKQNLPLLLGSADCHLVIQRVGADDAFLPSKLTNIFAVGGNAIVSASQNSFLAKLVSDNKGIAILVKPECCSSIVKGIEEALIMPIPNTLAKKYAYHNFDKDIVLNRFMEDIINFKQQ
jgi:colanic acid biosynthesis glycosyl transferase WcaI